MASSHRPDLLTPDIHFRGRTIDATRIDLVEEFHRDPLGRHSPELQELLWFLRTQDQGGRYVLLRSSERPAWTVARVAARGRPPTIVLDHPFNTREAAEWAVFAVRWCDHTGAWLDPYGWPS